MPKFENATNINNIEPNLNEAEADVNVEEKSEGELAPEESEKSEVEQDAEKQELSAEEQSKQIDKSIEATQKEMTRLSGSIESTKFAVNAAREGLGLPPTDEDPPSVFSNKDKLEKLKAEQTAFQKQKEELGSQKRNEESQESREGDENLKENDLIVPDNEVEPAKGILDKNEIQHKDREYTKRQVIDDKTDTVIPGEFVLSIFDSEHPGRPASFDFVKQVFELVKDSDIVVRYGKNPERG